MILTPARWFNPSLGRFLSPDTIVPTSTQGTQAWDRYAFVNNNPVRYTDPRGHGVDCGFGEDCVGNQTNPNDPTTTTVYAGGVNPASRPEIANDSNSGPSHPIVDGIVELYTFVQSFIASFVPNPSTEVDVLYTYTVNPDGSISQIIITVNNHDGGSSVALENVVIGMDDKAMHRPPFSVREGEYILDANHMVVNPGQSRRAIICGNCIAENPLLFFMPIHKNTIVDKEI